MIVKIFNVIRKSLRIFFTKDAFLKSAAISYYTIFSPPALLLLVLNIAGLFYKESEVKTAIMTQLSDLLGKSSSQAILNTIDQLQIFEPKFWASVISICTIIFTASTVFATLQSVLNDMFSVKAKPDQNTILQYMRSRLFSLGVIAGFAFLLLISLVLNSVLQMVGNLLDDYLGVLSSLMLKFGAVIIPIIINTLLFALIFKLLPDVKLKWRNTWFAAVVTAILFGLGKVGISFYVGTTDVGGIYGAAGSILVVMVWVFYATLIVLFGASLTKAIIDENDELFEPSRFASQID